VKEKTKLIILGFFVWIIPIVILGGLENEQEEQKNKHECTTFVKYKEHYRITPLTWYYRNSFKCIECGKDWKGETIK
jgi:hypothetical protein